MMAQVYDLYGAMNFSMNELRGEVEKVVGIKFDLHDSAYRGGEYFRAGALGGEEFVIQLNHFEFEGEPEIAEPQYSDYPVILQVAWTERGDDLRKKLRDIAGLEFLRRKSR
jgi:hypothetical protein